MPVAWELWGVLALMTAMLVLNLPQMLAEAVDDEGRRIHRFPMLMGVGVVVLLPLWGLWHRRRWAWWWYVLWLGSLPLVRFAHGRIEIWPPEAWAWTWVWAAVDWLIVALLILCRIRKAY